MTTLSCWQLSSANHVAVKRSNIRSKSLFFFYCVTILLFVLGCIFPASVAADDREILLSLFTNAPAGGTITIPPGDYALDGQQPIPIKSDLTVIAYGATFRFPASLGDQARAAMFSGEDITNLRWFGGHFEGNVFDPSKSDNHWAPNANTQAILITTTPGGDTDHLTFRDITSDSVAGAVITVLGAEQKGNPREVETYAKNVTVENCSLLRSGKFMWDYGYLWQITVWPEDYDKAEQAMARKYFRNDLVRGPVVMRTGEDRVYFNNEPQLPITDKLDGPDLHRGYKTICFYGDTLPTNIVRGKQYFVIESSPTYIRIAETAGGRPITFASDSGPQTKLITDLFQAHLALYAPTGAGPGKGAIDLVACEDVIVHGCRLSALGDTMHIQKSRSIVFNANHIAGSRMGAFFLAEYCQDALITGNTIDGSNGSRVMSVEKSCEDVTIIGNTFRNGGRGSWINQPRNFVLANNVFVNNTTKCEHDPSRGRKSFLTGGYEKYAELYFTTYEQDGKYENVIVQGNLFTSGPHAEHAMTFAPGGDTIIVKDNVFSGPVRDIAPIEGCENVVISDNLGLASESTFRLKDSNNR